MWFLKSTWQVKEAVNRGSLHRSLPPCNHNRWLFKIASDTLWLKNSSVYRAPAKVNLPEWCMHLSECQGLCPQASGCLYTCLSDLKLYLRASRFFSSFIKAVPDKVKEVCFSSSPELLVHSCALVPSSPWVSRDCWYVARLRQNALPRLTVKKGNTTVISASHTAFHCWVKPGVSTTFTKEDLEIWLTF